MLIPLKVLPAIAVTLTRFTPLMVLLPLAVPTRAIFWPLTVVAVALALLFVAVILSAEVLVAPEL